MSDVSFKPSLIEEGEVEEEVVVARTGDVDESDADGN